MSDDFIRKYQEAEALQETLRQLENPLAQQARTLHLASSDLRHALGQADIRDQVGGVRRIFADQERARAEAMRDALEPLKSVREALAHSVLGESRPYDVMQTHLNQAIFDYRGLTGSFTVELPDQAELAAMASLASRVSLPASLLEDFRSIEALLRTQMAAISQPWVVADLPDLSALAFGRLSAESSALLAASAFSDEHETAARALFGAPLDLSVWDATDDDLDARDEARVDAGAEPALLVIPAQARLQVGTSIGLVTPAPQPLTIRALDGSEVGFSSDGEAWLRAAEVKLRFFVVTALQRVYGDNWLRQLPFGLEASWIETRNRQMRAGRREYALYHYAQLGDWIQVINRHWKPLFAAVFGKKAHIETTFDHIIPLRNEEGHHRPIGELDELVAITYSRQLIERIDEFVVGNGWPPLGD